MHRHPEATHPMIRMGELNNRRAQTTSLCGHAILHPRVSLESPSLPRVPRGTKDRRPRCALMTQPTATASYVPRPGPCSRHYFPTPSPIRSQEPLSSSIHSRRIYEPYSEQCIVVFARRANSKVSAQWPNICKAYVVVSTLAFMREDSIAGFNYQTVKLKFCKPDVAAPSGTAGIPMKHRGPTSHGCPPLLCAPPPFDPHTYHTTTQHMLRLTPLATCRGLRSNMLCDPRNGCAPERRTTQRWRNWMGGIVRKCA